MKTHAPVLLAGAALLALGIWCLSIGSGTAADDKDDVKDNVLKLADAIEKDDADQAKKLAEAVAKAVDELDPVMNLMSPRNPKAKKAIGLGVGPTPGAILPDGIEKKIQALAKKAPPAGQLGKDADALAEMAYRVAAISEVAKLKPNDKVTKPQDKQDWANYTGEMKKRALELAMAAKAKNANAIKTAANKLNTACSNCHGKFRDTD